MRRMAVAAKFHHAVWGPDELFYGELYASRKVPCRPTLARPGTRDEYSACVGEELVEQDLYDLMLFSLPDNDYHSHRYGPAAQVDSIAHADHCFGSIVEATGGIDSFLDDHAVVLLADHSQSAVEHRLPLAEALEEEWRVLRPNADRPEEAELAVSPIARAGAVYVLEEGRRHARARPGSREAAGARPVSTSSRGSRHPTAGRSSAGVPARLRARISRRLSSGPARSCGSARAPGSRTSAGASGSSTAMRRCSARCATGASPATPTPMRSAGCGRRWSRRTRATFSSRSRIGTSASTGVTPRTSGGGSHGSLHRDDSLGPLLMVGLDQAVERPRAVDPARRLGACPGAFRGSGAPVHEGGRQPAIPLAEGREPATPLAELPNDSRDEAGGGGDDHGGARGSRADGRRRLDVATRAPGPPRDPQAGQLDPALQVRRRRRDGVHRQPDRVRDPRRGARASTTSSARSARSASR